MRCNLYIDHYIFKTELPKERYQLLRRLIPALPEEQPITDFYCTRQTADILELARAGFKFEVEGISNDREEGTNFALNILTMMNEMSKKLDSHPGFQKNMTLKIEQSHDVFLSRVNEVQVFPDFCTDELRRELDAGWRIIAVCHQKSSRRPDYIMGREKVT